MEGYEGSTVQCIVRNIHVSILEKKIKEITNNLENRYISSLEKMKLFTSDIANSESNFINKKEVTKEELDIIINTEMELKKYLKFSTIIKKQRFNVIKFLSYAIIINSLFIGYVIVVHPKLK